MFFVPARFSRFSRQSIQSIQSGTSQVAGQNKKEMEMLA